MYSQQLHQLLKEKATRLRIHSLRSTAEAGSGHPTSCLSAADITATLFFHVMHYDQLQPRISATQVSARWGPCSIRRAVGNTSPEGSSHDQELGRGRPTGSVSSSCLGAIADYVFPEDYGGSACDLPF